jgi:amidase
VIEVSEDGLVVNTQPQSEPPRSELELAFSSATVLARLLREGAITAETLTELYLERIERLDPQLNAFRVVRADAARRDAVEAQRRLDAGERAPLLGVPVAVKDVIDVAGERTMHGTGAVERVASEDAEAVRRLRAAGAVIVGKTHTPELAAWTSLTESKTWGPTRNPWNPSLSPGGSSGGSAVAVAAAMVAASLATDGGGSIRVPSATCGVFGLKPQRGRVPIAGGEHLYGLTHWGPITRTVADAVLLLDVLAGTSTSAAVAPPKSLRIGVLVEPQAPYARLDAERRAAIERTAVVLRDLGHHVDAARPRMSSYLPLAVAGAALPRYFAGIADDAASVDHPELLERRSRHMAWCGRRLHGRALRWARAAEQPLAARMNAALANADVLLAPVVPRALPQADHWAGQGAVRTLIGSLPWMYWTGGWNLTGQPAAAVPAGLDSAGLPVAVQLIARPGEERTILALAAQLEQAQPWAQRRPAVS